MTKTVRYEPEERFRLLVESVKDYAIFMLDPGGHVATWNLGAERIKGYTATDIIGKHFSTFYPPEDIAAGKCEYELEVAAREGRFEDEGWRIRKDGTRFWANVTITALRDQEGTLVGYAKVTRDLTERKQAEEKLRELAAERAALAEKARIQEFQERFMAVLGHDLRNPLASIDMSAALLRKKATDPSTIRVLDRVRASSARMSRMIAQILDLTRARLGGGLQLHLAAIDLQKLIRRVVEELQAVHPDRVINVDCPAVPGTWDRDRLEQVFSNLLGNALSHGDPSEPVTIEARAQADVVWVGVHNAGPPIPEEIQATLFDPFRRGNRTGRTARTNGLGLGLYISKEIVNAHGGRIDVHSVAGHGTTFEVALPLHLQPAAAAPISLSEPARGPSNGPRRP